MDLIASHVYCELEDVLLAFTDGCLQLFGREVSLPESKSLMCDELFNSMSFTNAG